MKQGPAYSLMRVIANIDDLLDIEPIKAKMRVDIDYEIHSTDQYIDLLENYESHYNIRLPKEMIVADTSTIKEIVRNIKKVLKETNKDKQYRTDTVIEYIDCIMAEEPLKKQLKTEKVVFDKKQLKEILNHYEKKYGIKFPDATFQDRTIEQLGKLVYDLHKTYHDPKYILIYAKLLENKATREVVMDGPFFGPQADSEDAMNVEAKKLVDAQQNSAILPKIFERMGRSDTEIMIDAKKRFKQIFERISEQE